MNKLERVNKNRPTTIVFFKYGEYKGTFEYDTFSAAYAAWEYDFPTTWSAHFYQGNKEVWSYIY